MIEYHVRINGIQVNASFREQTVEKIFLPLLQRLTALQKNRGKRILVMLAAPPGAGKSTLAGFLEQLAREQKEPDSFQSIGMDGFHRRQEYLVSHCTERNGRQIPMVEIKGAPVTFDLERLTDSVRRVASGATCGWPVYDRMLHNPVEDALTVSGKIILLEGNYLLLNEPGWSELRNYADYTVSVRAEEAFLRERLTDRKIKTGKDPEEAARFVDFSDMPNVRLCLEKTAEADLQLQLDRSGDYHLVSEKANRGD